MKRSSYLALFAGLVALAATAAAARPAAAAVILPPNPAFNLDVIYNSGGLISGPLSFGLRVLPNSVQANFVLGAGLLSSEPGGPTFRTFSIADVVSAKVSFGDGTWTENKLSSFTGITNGVFSSLTYGFDPITTPSAASSIIMNFPLTVTGTDIASGLAFEYRYATSTLALTAIPEPATISLFLIGLAGLGFAGRRRVV